MVSSEHTRRAQAAAHLALYLVNVRETTPDDESIAAIAVEAIAEIERTLTPPAK